MLTSIRIDEILDITKQIFFVELVAAPLRQ